MRSRILAWVLCVLAFTGCGKAYAPAYHEAQSAASSASVGLTGDGDVKIVVPSNLKWPSLKFDADLPASSAEPEENVAPAVGAEATAPQADVVALAAEVAALRQEVQALCREVAAMRVPTASARAAETTAN